MPSLPPSSTAQLPNIGSDQHDAPRKRRRRVPATGATEDCFTCRKRQANCDRRRPYCTQCIELGKECSGYRTTLTWGVGVASRGKLRGMSLPVPKSPSSPSMLTARERSQSMSHGKTITTTAVVLQHQQPSIPSPPQAQQYEQYERARRASNINQMSDVKSLSYTRSPPVHGYPSLKATSPISVSPPAPQQMLWHPPTFGEHFESCNRPASRKPRPQLPLNPLHNLYTSPAASYDDTGLSASTVPLSSYSDSVLGYYHLPGEVPDTPDHFTFADSMVQFYNEHYMQQCTPMSSLAESFTPSTPLTPFINTPASAPIYQVNTPIRPVENSPAMPSSSYGGSGFEDFGYSNTPPLLTSNFQSDSWRREPITTAGTGIAGSSLHSPAQPTSFEEAITTPDTDFDHSADNLLFD